MKRLVSLSLAVASLLAMSDTRPIMPIDAAPEPYDKSKKAKNIRKSMQRPDKPHDKMAAKMKAKKSIFRP